MDYIKSAQKRYELRRGGLTPPQSGPLNQFYAYCHQFMNPNEYGAHSERRIMNDLGLERCTRNIDAKAYTGRYNKEVKVEIKTSYKGLNGLYSVRNLRLWQDVNFYLLCLIDPDNNYEPRFMLLTKEDMYYRLRLNRMNSDNVTKEASSINTIEKVGMGAQINEEKVNKLMKHNFLRGDSFEDVKRFFNYRKLK